MNDMYHDRIPDPVEPSAGDPAPQSSPEAPQQPQSYSEAPQQMPVYTEIPWQPQGFPEPPHYTQSIPRAPQPAPSYATPPKKQRKNRKGIALAALALCFSLLGSLFGGGLVLLMQQDPQQQQQEAPTASSGNSDSSSMLEGNRENTVIDIVQIETGKLLTAAEVYAANVQSTVGITTSITTNYWGYQSTSAASGSGFIVTDDGYIITNFHVIEDSDSITVSLYSGDTYDADLVGYDESNDLAVLKIEAEGLSPVILGDSDNLNVGDSVVAIGNPLGELTFSLTSGSTSAKDREVTMSNSLTMNLLQTDCAINSGNSGGALFNMYGEVIGITNAKYSSSGSEASIDNIGFAIPINDVRSIVESIIEKGYYSKPYLGVSVSDVSREYQIYGLPQGAAIQTITEGSPAEDAGLQVGDIITGVDGTEITGSTDLTSIIGRCKVGDKVALTVYRQGETLEISVTIGEQIQSTTPEQEENNSQGNYPWNRG